MNRVMSEQEFYPILLYAFLGIGVIVFVVLFFIPAPYGRHVRSGWGLRLSSRWGWMWMELPAALLFLVFFLLGQRKDVVPVIFLFVWISHYFHRAFIYPFTIRSRKSMPVSVLCFGLIFNAVNPYVQARWIYTLAPATAYAKGWLTDFRFIFGISVFFIGFLINLRADHHLRSLRKPGETGYNVPERGLFRWISCPNYLGESVEWTGWAVAVWSLSGLTYALWAVFNLFPRARAHHLWYRKTFPNYPSDRKALIPYIL